MARYPGFYPAMLCLLLFIVAQLFFLDADPHSEVSTSRGPFTDEGLNTFHARNFVNHGSWGLEEGDNLIKSPLYNGYLAAALTFTNGSRTALRLTVLLTCLALWLWLGALLRNFHIPALFLLFGGFQYHLFQFYHFTMAEVLVISCTLLSIGFGYRYLRDVADGTGKASNLIFSFLALFAAFLLKIQYAYLLLLPPLFCLGGIIIQREERTRLWRHLLMLLILVGGSGLLFILAWYLPTQEVFEKVWAHQGSNRFTGIDKAWEAFSNSGKYLIWNKYNLPFAISFLLSLPLGVFLIVRSRQADVRILLVLVAAWILIELHKPFILYLPTRYVLSLFSAQALWMAATLYGGILHLSANLKITGPNRFLRVLPLLFAVPLILGHYDNMQQLWNEKTRYSQEIIDTYNQLDLNGQTVAGVWATSLVWNKTAYVIPVWKNFMNDDHILEKRQPAIVVTEEGEPDSQGVFKDRGINLSALADSSRTYKYGSYTINFYFMSYPQAGRPAN